MPCMQLPLSVALCHRKTRAVSHHMNLRHPGFIVCAPSDGGVTRRFVALDATTMPIHGLSLSDNQLAAVINLVLPGWILLAVVPRWRASYFVALVGAINVGVAYVASMVSFMAKPPKEFGTTQDMFNFEGVQRFLREPATTIPALTHYCVLDLWTGMWVASDSVSHGVPQLLMVPCLMLVMLIGPAGLLLYLAVRLPWAGLRVPSAPPTARKAKTS